MSFIVYKRFGKQEYAYELTSYWNSKKQRSQHKTKYLGVVIDKQKNIFERKARKKDSEKLILDFGDAFIFNKFIENIEFSQLIKDVFSEKTDMMLAILAYRLCYGSAMVYASTWFEGSYAKMLYKNCNVSSQKISQFFENIGDESIQRIFFSKYISTFSKAKRGIIIDGTSLPNQIHMPMSAWGLSGEEIDKQIRFLLVVDKETTLPLFFRILPGNILDLSALTNTLEELKKYGIKESFVYVDAGFFSEDNIKEMYVNNIDFLTRLPSLRIIYKEMINNEIDDLESLKYAVKYGKRAMFVKQKEIELFGKKAYAHIVLDPERKGREVKKFLLQIIDEKSQHDENEMEYSLSKRGIMILVSSFKIDKEEVVPTYYVRQTAEKLFGFSKDDLNILPLRVHSEKSSSGFLFMQFLALIAFTKLKKEIGKEYTVEEILLTMRNLKCKVYDDEIRINELTKQQKEISEKLGFIVPKKLGI